jgi:hypothetical protein
MCAYRVERAIARQQKRETPKPFYSETDKPTVVHDPFRRKLVADSQVSIGDLAGEDRFDA